MPCTGSRGVAHTFWNVGPVHARADEPAAPLRLDREVIALRVAAQGKVRVPGVVFSAVGPPSLLALQRIDGPELSELPAQAA
jgi:hypothetical protein